MLGSLFASSALLAAACQNSERELGYTQTDQDLRGQPSEPAEPFFDGPDAFVGRWIGTASDPLAFGDDATYAFPSGSGQFLLDVALEVDEFGNSQLLTSLTFGEAEPLPPPTDPELGYPVGLSYNDLLTYDESVGIPGTNPDYRLPPFEGFSYHADAAVVYFDDTPSLGDGLLTLAFNVNQPLDAWCQLQTPFEVPDAPGLFLCSELFGGQTEFNPDGTGASCELYGPPDTSNCPDDPTAEEAIECFDAGEPVATTNCDKLFLCTNNYCQCYEYGCFAGESQNQLVLRREGDELVGAFAGTTFLNARNMKTPLGEVHFQRAD